MASLWTGITTLWAQGGFVMPWLVGSSIVLWWAIGERIFTLRRGDKRPLNVLIQEALANKLRERGIVATAVTRVAALPASQRTEGRVREVLADLAVGLDRHRVLITSLAATAPLIGLLGTVSGMIGTFDSLTSMAPGGTSGIAGGISEALISTQMGLSVAIPALLAGRLLDKAQHSLEDELHALPELFSTAAGGA
jgi:biopolymer transport protein ExbB